MRKTVYLLNIGDYAPEVTELTYPTIYAWADRIGAEVIVIRHRAYKDWPLTYEKLQIHGIAKGRNDDWAIYIDSDTLVHPELPDITDLIPRDHVCHNALDWAPIRWTLDDYFRRDGRMVGSANWFACASSWCLDLWRPLDDLTPEQAIANIHVTEAESKWMKAEHLIDDYALSRNIARFGLKVTTLNALWQAGNLFVPNPETGVIQGPDFFYHQYLMDADTKVKEIKEKIEFWGI